MDSYNCIKCKKITIWIREVVELKIGSDTIYYCLSCLPEEILNYQ